MMCVLVCLCCGRGAGDVLDECRGGVLHRYLFDSRNGPCRLRSSDFEVPLETCVGPFGKPRPTGYFSCLGEASSAGGKGSALATRAVAASAVLTAPKSPTVQLVARRDVSAGLDGRRVDLDLDESTLASVYQAIAQALHRSVQRRYSGETYAAA